MFIIESPYISNFLSEYLIKSQLPVLKTEFIMNQKEAQAYNLLNEEEFKNHYESQESPKIYTNSEDALAWIINNLDNDDLKRQITACKDKALFRKMLKKLHPDYKYQVIDLNELSEIKPEMLDFPIIIKPSVGFLSFGVQRINCRSQWNLYLEELEGTIDQYKGIFPESVVDTNKFIIESCIEGEEYAIDLYYDDQGKPVILNILHHRFASQEDMSDRLYVTSLGIIKDRTDDFHAELEAFGNLAEFRNFPMHFELRITPEGKCIPIEANPLRFAGWCCTDIAYYAYGMNTYELFFSNSQPDWTALQAKIGSTPAFGLTVADIPSDLDKTKISIEYTAFQEHFSELLELRKTHYQKFGVFAFAFAKYKDISDSELQQNLTCDFRKYMSIP